MDCSRREISIGVRNGKRTVQDIKGCDVVIDVHNSRGRINGQDDALHGAYQMIPGAKVGSESDDRIGQ
jgi:hypothetical protein